MSGSKQRWFWGLDARIWSGPKNLCSQNFAVSTLRRWRFACSTPGSMIPKWFSQFLERPSNVDFLTALHAKPQLSLACETGRRTWARLSSLGKSLAATVPNWGCECVCGWGGIWLRVRNGLCNEQLHDVFWRPKILEGCICTKFSELLSLHQLFY